MTATTKMTEADLENLSQPANPPKAVKCIPAFQLPNIFAAPSKRFAEKLGKHLKAIETNLAKIPAKLAAESPKLGAAGFTIGHALIRPQMHDLVHRADIGIKIADQIAERRFQHRQPVFLNDAQELLHLARVQRVSPLLEDHFSFPLLYTQGP